MLLLLIACVRGPVVDPEALAASRVDPAALERLVAAAEASGSDSLYVAQGGHVLVDWERRDAPLETMSVTKTVVGLAVAILADEGRLSLEDPVSRFFAEWSDGPTAAVTVRHLVEHTSGLRPYTHGWPLVVRLDVVRTALDSPLQGEPGAAWEYNNNAVNLLGAVVARAAGQPLDRFVARRIFLPLGIERWEWRRDRFGHALGMAGLRLRPDDLEKIGRLLLRQGSWEGEQLVPGWWFTDVLAAPPGERTEHLLWVVPEARCVIGEDLLLDWAAAGADLAFVSRVGALAADGPVGIGELMEALGGREALNVAFLEHLPPDADHCRVDYRTIGYAATGYLGQYVVVVPEDELLVIRQRRWSPLAGRRAWMPGWWRLLRALAR